jgi:DNA-binding response OmpR family regulator
MSRNLALLLVEDDPTLGPLTAEALRQFGHHVALAPSVDMAFRWMKAANECDAIVLDLDVGDEPGELLIERLLDASMHVPEVLVVSAQPMNVLARVVERLDACTCLQKPCTASAINEELVLRSCIVVALASKPLRIERTDAAPRSSPTLATATDFV